TAALRLSGPLHVEALERSFHETIQRHEALRTVFAVVAGQPLQVITPAQAQPMPVIDLRDRPDGDCEAAALHWAAEDARQFYDLTVGPLFRVRLMRLDEQQHVLALTMHHIVSDGWSLGVFLRELAALYAAYCAGKPSPLPDPSIQYADFAVWQRQWLQ